MAKMKIYDIAPPGKRPQYPSQVKQVKLESKRRSAKKKPVLPFSGKKFPKRKIFLILLAVVFGLIIYWSLSVANKVVIEILPNVFPVEFTASVSFSTGETDFDLADMELSNPVLPAEFLEMEKTLNKEFSASAIDAEEKATGVIRAYSEASRDITLVEGTRFLSSTEPTRQFHTLKRITIPAGGNIDVPVIASEAGEEYNIEPCTFSVPGLRNYSPPQLYYDIYGKSLEKMSGGSIGSVKKITEKDADNAGKEIRDIAEEQALDLMKKEAGDDYRVLDKSLEIEVLREGLLDAAVGQQMEDFNYEITVKSSALVIKREYLDKFAQKYLLSSVPANKSFQDNNFKIEFLPGDFSAEPDEQGIVNVSADISISSNIYSQVDVQSIKEVAKNRDRKSISRYVIEIYPDIRKTPGISFSPFWARKAGGDSESIEVKLNFD